MNRIINIFLHSFIISMSIIGGEKHKVFITNHCLQSIQVNGRLLRPDVENASFFAEIKPYETIDNIDALVINELILKDRVKKNDLKKNVYVPLIWGDKIVLLEELSGDITIMRAEK